MPFSSGERVIQGVGVLSTAYTYRYLIALFLYDLDNLQVTFMERLETTYDEGAVLMLSIRRHHMYIR